MSKEMMIIALGVFIILVRTSLGLPGSWQTPLIVLAGILIAILGFLLRGEAIERGAHSTSAKHQNRYSFVEHGPSEPKADAESGITSLN